MLSKKNKIKRKEFPVVLKFKKNVFFNSKYAFLLIQKQYEKKPSKFSFVVSGKVSKKAVIRNRLKRRGYYVIRKILPDIKKGYIAVFFLKKEIIGIPYVEFEKQILFLLKKSKLLNNI